MFLIKNDVDFSTECGYLKNDIHRLRLEFKNISMEQYENYLDYKKIKKNQLLKEF